MDDNNSCNLHESHLNKDAIDLSSCKPRKRQVRPKVSSEWSDDEIFKLILTVECLPMLWNAMDEKYKNKIERQAAWKQISEVDFENKFEGKEIMAKWTNIRIQYRSYFAKYRKTKSGQESNEHVKWKFFEAMDFIGRAKEDKTPATVSNWTNDDMIETSTIDTTQTSERRRLSQLSSCKPRKRQVRPKVSSEWSDDEIFKLILTVECLPMLWNTMDENHKNKIERQAAWKQISEVDFENKFEGKEIMAKWTNIRIQYRSYFAKYRKTKSGEESNEHVKWKFFEAMDFIGRAEENQTPATVSNLTNDDTIETSTTQTSKLRRLSQLSTNSTTSAASIVAEAMRESVEKLKEQRQNRNEDEFDVFGKYVAAELRSFSDANAARRVRWKVNRFLMDCVEEENQSK